LRPTALVRDCSGSCPHHVPAPPHAANHSSGKAVLRQADLGSAITSQHRLDSLVLGRSDREPYATTIRAHIRIDPDAVPARSAPPDHSSDDAGRMVANYGSEGWGFESLRVRKMASDKRERCGGCFHSLLGSYAQRFDLSCIAGVDLAEAAGRCSSLTRGFAASGGAGMVTNLSLEGHHCGLR
jgi:hypothetical protein